MTWSSYGNRSMSFLRWIIREGVLISHSVTASTWLNLFFIEGPVIGQLMIMSEVHGAKHFHWLYLAGQHHKAQLEVRLRKFGMS
jgi:hypothetical protein